MDERRQYATWFYGLSASRRKELKTKGLHPDHWDASIGSTRSLDRLVEQYGKPDSDPLLRSEDPALSALLNDGVGEEADATIPRTTFISYVRFLVGAYGLSKDKKVLTHSLVVQAALCLTEAPQSALCHSIGMTPSAFNWRVRKMQEALGLPSYRTEEHRARQSDGMTRAWRKKNGSSEAT